ncbi:FH2 domain-containing protein 1-like isoform X2 [Chrysemys picta bellii]|uniref:FH2 domain-containing protein 1-like isoform X2 n=1 Tax=Chrysemys picta bellii TaxID=8478 RepID=UPI0032B2E82B
MGQSQQLPSGAPGTPGSPSPKHSALLPLPRAPAPPVPAPGAPAPSVPPPLPGSPAPRVPLPVPPAPPVPPPVPPAPPVPPPLPVAPPVLPPPRDALMPAPHRSKLRTFHWTVIPAERVRGRPSVWTASSQHDHTPLDVEHLEELFGEQPGWGPRGPLLLGRPQGQVSLLDSKKILNLEIFLKQFKRPVQQIVADLRAGAGALYGAEKLLELCKMLPDTDEVKKLRAFQGSWRQLSDAETFSLLLVGVPSYARRLELLVLKEEFFPQLNSLKSSIQILTEAARELLGCEELHVVIRLVLRAGNYMNMGGYAGHAAGFRMASLLRLADTKANKPGVDLLHFVAMEAERRDRSLLDFPSKLEHVGLASRIQEQEVALELQGLGERLAGARGSLTELGPEQLEPFLQLGQAELDAVQAELERLRQATAALRDFYCEDEALFCLQEVCAVLHVFGGRFRTAVQENRAREQAEQRRQQLERQRQEKRRSIATCSVREPELQDVKLNFLLTRTPQPCRRSHVPRGPRTGPCGNLDLGAGECPDWVAPPEPLARGAGQRRLSRRHTLAILPAHPEPQDSLGPAPAPPPGPPATPVGRKGGLMSWLPERLPSPGASPKAEGCSPDTSPSRPFPSLFCKKGPPMGAEGQAAPGSPTASPKGVSTLAGFFWRLGLAEKPLRPSQS